MNITKANVLLTRLLRTRKLIDKKKLVPFFNCTVLSNLENNMISISCMASSSVLFNLKKVVKRFNRIIGIKLGTH